MVITINGTTNNSDYTYGSIVVPSGDAAYKDDGNYDHDDHDHDHDNNNAVDTTCQRQGRASVRRKKLIILASLATIAGIATTTVAIMTKPFRSKEQDDTNSGNLVSLSSGLVVHQKANCNIDDATGVPVTATYDSNGDYCFEHVSISVFCWLPTDCFPYPESVWSGISGQLSGDCGLPCTQTQAAIEDESIRFLH